MTEFTIHRSQFLPAIAAVRAAIERRNTIPILSNALIAQADDGRIAVTATDLDIRVTATAETVSGEASREGITLPLARLYDIVNRLPEAAEIAVRAQDADATITAGRSRFRLHSLPASDFPETSPPQYDIEWKMPGRLLARAVDACLFSIGDEETRYYLNGIHFHHGGEDSEPSLVAVATNGKTLARIVIPAESFEDYGPFPAAIVPSKACRLLRQLADKAGDDPVSVAASADGWRLSADGTVIETKLIAAQYPDYRRVIPTGNDKRLGVDSRQLVEACKRISAVSDKREKAIRIDIADGAMTLNLRDMDNGEAAEDVQADLDGEPISLGVNVDYLAGTVDALDCDKTSISLRDALSPVLFEPERQPDGFSLLSVVMPMRIPS
ncbi:DNA polymerase III subunit beta [Oricola thermophila]|uniref:Beta sliding clamp n=1 Tax=Oricola thermophila TaxID=2742145 RepID=A0A6N1VD00_9HYPH|nr:DNA polymerase III subunit beta [Oricola thermophila]QKV18754.1 DNA polymerase III subunit beta [Oricola thermophila]